jgi:UDPglucose--hexose-1-phosphate uridylyltransferase
MALVPGTSSPCGPPRRVSDPPQVASSDIAASSGLLAKVHRRYNPLTDEWVLVSPARTERPWLGREEPVSDDPLPAYDPTCYLCPGNKRVGGQQNPDYDRTLVFTNDFSALREDSPLGSLQDGLLRAEGERGTCRVLCFSPRHDLGLGQLAPAEIRHVIDVWAEQTAELGTSYQWVQVFENRGEQMGASNPHPHGQIWAGTALPREAARELATQRHYREEHGTSLLLDYAAQEAGGPRVVAQNDSWLVVVPFWAAWPYETLVLPRQPVQRLPDLDDRARDELVSAMVELLGEYDGLFRQPFPYSMGWHQAPFDGQDHPEWQLHAHYDPPLLRSATVRKFMVGYELLAETQRDTTPEDAAQRLRSVARARPRRELGAASPSA